MRRIGRPQLWTVAGPTDEAVRLLTRGAELSQGETLMLRGAWDVWGGHGKLTVAEMMLLDSSNLTALATLIESTRRGSESIDQWLIGQNEVLP